MKFSMKFLSTKKIGIGLLIFALALIGLCVFAVVANRFYLPACTAINPDDTGTAVAVVEPGLQDCIDDLCVGSYSQFQDAQYVDAAGQLQSGVTTVIGVSARDIGATPALRVYPGQEFMAFQRHFRVLEICRSAELDSNVVKVAVKPVTKNAVAPIDQTIAVPPDLQLLRSTLFIRPRFYQEGPYIDANGTLTQGATVELWAHIIDERTQNLYARAYVGQTLQLGRYQVRALSITQDKVQIHLTTNPNQDYRVNEITKIPSGTGNKLNETVDVRLDSEFEFKNLAIIARNRMPAYYISPKGEKTLGPTAELWIAVQGDPAQSRYARVYPGKIIDVDNYLLRIEGVGTYHRRENDKSIYVRMQIMDRPPITTAAPQTSGAAALPQKFEFFSGGAYHPEGFGEWRVRLDSTGVFSAGHNLFGDVTTYGPFTLTETENQELWRLILAADIPNLPPTFQRPGIPDETAYTFTLYDGDTTYTAEMWVDEAKAYPGIPPLVELIRKMVEVHTGKKME